MTRDKCSPKKAYRLLNVVFAYVLFRPCSPFSAAIRVAVTKQ